MFLGSDARKATFPKSGRSSVCWESSGNLGLPPLWGISAWREGWGAGAYRWVAKVGWSYLSLFVSGQLAGAFLQGGLQMINELLLQHLISTWKKACEALTAHFRAARAG